MRGPGDYAQAGARTGDRWRGADPIETPARITGYGLNDLPCDCDLETRALDARYDHVGRRAFGLAYRYRILGDGASAEDAVQEAFVALWQQAARLDPARGRVDSLLLTIVHRRAVDIVRRRRGHASASFMMDVYAHLLSGQQTRAAEAFDHLLGGA